MDDFLFKNDFNKHFSNFITERSILKKSDFAKNFNDSDMFSLFERYTDHRPALESDERTPLLDGDNPKLVICFKRGVWHTWGESFTIALEWIRRNPGGVVLFLIANKFEQNDYSKYFFDLFLSYIRSIGSDAFIFDDTVDQVSIKNFQFFLTYRRKLGYHLISNLKDVRNKYGSEYKPFRKVYISRSKTLHKETNFTTGTDLKDIIYLNRFDDQRCDNEYQLEQYLIRLGFEILYPEDFINMEDQIKFFSEVKTLMSITHSGISNMIWTPDNAKIIEVTIPILVNQQEILEYQWFELAFLLQRPYMCIPSFPGNAEDIIYKIENTPSLKNFLCE